MKLDLHPFLRGTFARCFVCGEPATSFTGHVHVSDETFILGWCAKHERTPKNCSEPTVAEPHCTGCYGRIALVPETALEDALRRIRQDAIGVEGTFAARVRMHVAAVLRVALKEGEKRMTRLTLAEAQRILETEPIGTERYAMANTIVSLHAAVQANEEYCTKLGKQHDVMTAALERLQHEKGIAGLVAGNALDEVDDLEGLK